MRLQPLWCRDTVIARWRTACGSVSRQTFLGFSCVGLISVTGCQVDDQAATVKGPETTELVQKLKGYMVRDQPVGGIVAIELPSLKKMVVRPADTNDPKIGTVIALSGPDRRQRIAYVENFMGAQSYHKLKVIQLDRWMIAVLRQHSVQRTSNSMAHVQTGEEPLWRRDDGLVCPGRNSPVVDGPHNVGVARVRRDAVVGVGGRVRRQHGDPSV